MMLRFSIGMLLVLVLMAGCRVVSELDDATKGGEWLMYRGNPTLSGWADVDLPAHPALAWEYKHGVRCVASPLVQDGVAYVCDKHGVLVGVDEQGSEVLRVDGQTAVEATAVMDDSLMYVGQIDGKIRALVRNTGREVWSFATDGQISAPLSKVEMNGREWVMAGSYDGCFYVLDAATGKVGGKVETGYYVNGAAAVCGEYAVFGGCDAWLRVVDCRRGLATDSVELSAYIPASPAVVEGCVYVADYSGTVWECRLDDEGRIASQRVLLHPADDEGGMLSSPAVSADAVYVLADTRYLYCLNRDDGSLRWRTMLKGEVGESSPLVCGDKVLVCTKSGVVSVHDAAGGKCLWEYETGEPIISSPAVTADGFYVLTARGTLLYFQDEKIK